nr:neutral/alkaline non-lysosomal ceramidase N-terminal domain-containing protein [uncultured Carboxylicivirga sp.]
MKIKSIVSIFIILSVNIISGLSQSKQASFMVGAAKIDITPSEDNLPKGFFRIHDNLFIRAIVIDNGTTSAALIAVDRGMIRNDFYEKITQQINKETGIPANNIFISPSHTHSSPWGSGPEVENGILTAVKQAKGKMQKASISYKTGLSFLNINRDVIDPETRLWKQGPNFDGPSDKTVAVIKFSDASGKPIAVYYNYAMHANMMFMGGSISADFPGVTSKYIEDYYQDDVVAIFSSGAAGDQNPISVNPMTDVASQKTDALLANGKAKELGEAIMMAGMGGESEVKIDEEYLHRQEQMIASLGQILAEEILRVMNLPQRAEINNSIFATQETISCPGRKRTNTGREGAPGTYVDGDSVFIKLSLLRVGDIAISGVNAEVYNLIAQKLKNESPLTNTIFSSITNGAANSGYIPSDDAFQRYTFQVLSSSLKPNYAERGIIDGLVGMIEKSL